jgi:hypothetical protein
MGSHAPFLNLYACTVSTQAHSPLPRSRDRACSTLCLSAASGTPESQLRSRAAYEIGIVRNVAPNLRDVLDVYREWSLNVPKQKRS